MSKTSKEALAQAAEMRRGYDISIDAHLEKAIAEALDSFAAARVAAVEAERDGYVTELLLQRENEHNVMGDLLRTRAKLGEALADLRLAHEQTAARVFEAVIAERERILSFTQTVLENDELGWGESFDLVIAWIAGGEQ